MFEEFLKKETPEPPSNPKSSNAHSVESEVISATPLELSQYINFDSECSGIFSEKEIAMAKQSAKDR